MKKEKFTRGTGVLENYLSRKRAFEVDKYIENNFRQGKILDIGCGSFPFFLSNINFKEKVGIDKHVEESSVDGISLKRMDFCGKSLDFSDESFNVVSMLALVEHIYINEAIDLFNEARRVLKKDGLLILTTPEKKADKILRIMARLNLVSKEEIDEHKQAYTKKELKKQLSEAGFEEENIRIKTFELGLNLIAVVKK